MDILPITLSVILAFASTLSAGIFIKKLQSRIGIVCAFSAGFFIALSFFDLLPKILTLAPETQIPTEQLLLTATAGFTLLFGLNWGFSRYHKKDHRMMKTTLQPRVGLLATLEFCSHAVLEGLAIGVSFQLEFGLGLFVAVAVISHNFCDGVSTLALMLNSGNTLKSSIGMLFVDALAPVLGAAITLFFAIESFILIYALSFLFGSFLYIGFGTLLPDAYKMNRPIVTAALFLTGFTTIILLSKIVG